MPAGGAGILAVLSNFQEKHLCRRSDDLGERAIKGAAGPEAASNASATGVSVPLLTRGLLTSAMAAMMLLAFQSFVINPGPTLLTSPPVWCGD